MMKLTKMIEVSADPLCVDIYVIEKMLERMARVRRNSPRSNPKVKDFYICHLYQDILMSMSKRSYEISEHLTLNCDIHVFNDNHPFDDIYYYRDVIDGQYFYSYGDREKDRMWWGVRPSDAETSRTIMEHKKEYLLLLKKRLIKRLRSRLRHERDNPIYKIEEP